MEQFKGQTPGLKSLVFNHVSMLLCFISPVLNRLILMLALLKVDTLLSSDALLPTFSDALLPPFSDALLPLFSEMEDLAA